MIDTLYSNLVVYSQFSFICIIVFGFAVATESSLGDAQAVMKSLITTFSLVGLSSSIAVTYRISSLLASSKNENKSRIEKMFIGSTVWIRFFARNATYLSLLLQFITLGINQCLKQENINVFKILATVYGAAFISIIINLCIMEGTTPDDLPHAKGLFEAKPSSAISTSRNTSHSNYFTLSTTGSKSPPKYSTLDLETEDEFKQESKSDLDIDISRSLGLNSRAQSPVPGSIPPSSPFVAPTLRSSNSQELGLVGPVVDPIAVRMRSESDDRSLEPSPADDSASRTVSITAESARNASGKRAGELQEVPEAHLVDSDRTVGRHLAAAIARRGMYWWYLIGGGLLLAVSSPLWLPPALLLGPPLVVGYYLLYRPLVWILRLLGWRS